MDLTKSAKKPLAILYKEYCQRVKSGISKQSAISFIKGEYPDFILDDVKELCNAKMIWFDMAQTIWFEPDGIIFMEKQEEKTLKKWLSFGGKAASKVIPHVLPEILSLICRK